MPHERAITYSLINNVLDEAELFPGDDGAVYARFDLNDERVTYPTTS